MLLEVEGERVRVFTGLGMRWLQLLGPVLGVDWGRRDFLRRAGGALIAQITLFLLNLMKPQVGEGQA